MRSPWLQSLLARRCRTRHKSLLRVPFIGRQGVLTTLGVRLREATEGGQVFVVLQGPAGSGKSALLEEFMARYCQSSAVLLVTVNAADCLLAQDVFASLLADLRARSHQIMQKMYRDTRRLRSLKGLNWDDADFTRMIAGTDRAQTGQGGAPLASLLARVRQHPWAVAAATALDGLNRMGDAALRDPQQRWADLMGSIRARIEAGKAALVVVIDQVDSLEEVPKGAAQGEPVHAAWAAFADILSQARVPALVVWAGLAEAVEPVRSGLSGQVELATCALEPLIGEEQERLCQQLTRCLPSTTRTAWREALKGTHDTHLPAWLYLAAAAAAAEDGTPQTLRALVREDAGALVNRVLRRIARDHPDAAALWDELLEAWAFLPPGKLVGIEAFMIRCADDAASPDPAALRAGIERLLGQGVRYGLLRHDPYRMQYTTGHTGIQASLQSFLHPDPAARWQRKRLWRLAAAILAHVHEGQRARLPALAELVEAVAPADDATWNLALLTPFRRLLAICGVVERQRMAMALGGFSSPLSVALLSFMLRDAEGRVRSAAVQSLADLALPQAAAVLIEALADDNSDVRWIATRALGDLTGSSVVDALIPMLTDEDKEVGRVAAEALGRQADRRAVPHLIAALRESYPLLRESAALALGHLADARAMSALRDLMGDDSPQVRRSTEHALSRITRTPH
jgi:hypothetical protein